MKTRRQNKWILTLAATVLATVAFAQGNRHGDHKGKEKGGVSSHHHADRRWDYRDTHDMHHEKYSHYHHHGHHAYQRSPRYVFYRDYNVYYDRARNVYICPSSKGWVVTSGLPARMHGVHVHRTPAFAVDYYGNSLGEYLAHHRPNYIQFQVTW